LKKTAARAYKKLIEASTNAMLIETQENIRNWFAHCCYYLITIRNAIKLIWEGDKDI
jgi:hypothetical protein